VKTELRWFIGGAEAHYALSAATPAVATLIKVYSHATLGTPVARIERTSNAVNTIEYQFHGLGSNTIAAVSGEGVVNASFAYAPYGEVIESTDVGALPANGLNGKDKHRRRVTDKYIDEASGLAYFGARYYDNILMGWTQGDPLYRFNPDTGYSAPRKSNLYMYVIGNPVRYLDPDGLGVSDWLLARIGDVAVTAMYAGPAGSAATSMGASYNGVRENSHSTATWGQVATGAKSSLYVVPYLGTALAAKDVVQADNNLDRAVAITALVLPKVISEAKGLVAESRAAAAEARTVATTNSLHAEAEAARDSLSATLATQKHPPATVVGAYSPSSGKVAAGASRGGGRGCAEGVCSEILGNPADIQFTVAIRPRTGKPVSVCEFCQETYGKPAFPDPKTMFAPDKVPK
jgi:RHS repeat-associated protein